ncbi:ORF6N domain-containing protein [Mucilaginibacter rubeus]|uniref:ORF6N domain-containing protein n=2 Tax=Mucilaginibacter rubeus TaxID=2027860 RepID=UPI001E6339D0|nr:ORF6N domain-containing protein [Mucilaginibacter rubeus]
MKTTMANNDLIPEEIVVKQIYYIRGQKVMLDSDLATLYQVETKQLKRQVRRNIERFPGEDFMFELTPDEYSLISRSQNGTMKQGYNIKYAPMVFTELGISMLSSVLNSAAAIQVNIRIMRIFIRLRQILIDNTELKLEIERIRTKLESQDKNIDLLFGYLDELIEKKSQPMDRKRIGYMPDTDSF